MQTDEQPELFGYPAPEATHFDGDTFQPEFDLGRLNAQLARVYSAMIDGRFRTLHEIAEITHDGEASISARLRDFRKPRFGSFDVIRQRRIEGSGLYEYRLVRNR